MTLFQIAQISTFTKNWSRVNRRYIKIRLHNTLPGKVTFYWVTLRLSSFMYVFNCLMMTKKPKHATNNKTD